MPSLKRILENKLASDSLIVVFWQAMRLISSYILMFAFARMMTIEDVGRYANFLALTSLAVPIFLLKPEAMVARAKFFNDGPGFAAYAGSVLAYCLIGSVLSALVVLVLAPWTVRATGIDSVWLLMLVPYLMAYGSLYVTSTIIQLDGDMTRSALTRGLEGVFRLIFGLLLVGVAALSWRGALIAVTAGITVAALLSWQILRGKGITLPVPNLSRVREYWHEGFPTVPMTLGFAALQSIDRFAITLRLGLNDAGIYAFGAMMASGIWLLGFAFQQAWAPWLYELLANPKSSRVGELKVAFLGYLSAISFAGATILLGTLLVIPWYLGAQYGGLNSLIGPLVLASILSAARLVLESVFYYYKKTWRLSTIAFIGLLCSAVGIYLSIDPYGVVGVAWAMVGANAVILVATALMAGRDLGDDLRRRLEG